MASEAVTYRLGTTFRVEGGQWDNCFYTLTGDQAVKPGDVILGNYRVTEPIQGGKVPRLMLIKEGTTTDG